MTATFLKLQQQLVGSLFWNILWVIDGLFVPSQLSCPFSMSKAWFTPKQRQTKVDERSAPIGCCWVWNLSWNMQAGHSAQSESSVSQTSFDGYWTCSDGDQLTLIDSSTVCDALKSALVCPRLYTMKCIIVMETVTDSFSISYPMRRETFLSCNNISIWAAGQQPRFMPPYVSTNRIGLASHCAHMLFYMYMDQHIALQSFPRIFHLV